MTHSPSAVARRVLDVESAALVQGDSLQGIITDGDLRRNMDGLMDHTAPL